MLNLNKILIITLSVFIGSMPIFAHAGSLTVVNNTNRDSTTVTNDFQCSDHLPGGKGVTKAHSTNVIPENTVNIACIKNKENCKADVYMSDNCSGTKVATVIFSTKTGIKGSPVIYDNAYQISGSGFYIQMDGG